MWLSSNSVQFKTMQLAWRGLDAHYLVILRETKLWLSSVMAYIFKQKLKVYDKKKQFLKIISLLSTCHWFSTPLQWISWQAICAVAKPRCSNTEDSETMMPVSLQQQVYRCQIRYSDHQKERLVEEWRHFYQSIIDSTVNQWRDRLCKCVRYNTRDFQHLI